IPVIADQFIQEFSLKHEKQIPHLLSSTLHMLQNYDWPGNVRELRNVVERMILFNEKETVAPKDLAEVFPAARSKESGEAAHTGGLLYQDRAAMEKERITATLRETYGNKSAAARLLGISRVSLYKKMREYGIPL